MATDFITRGNFTLEPTLADTVIGEIQKASAFQSVTNYTEIDSKGSIIPFVGNSRAAWITETQTKPVINPPTTEVTVAGKKMAKVALFSSELKDNHEKLTDKILAESVGSLARTFDATVAGDVSAPVGFDTLATGTETVVVTGRASFVAAIAPRNRRKTSAIVLNSELLFELLALSNNSEVGVLQFGGDNIYDAGSINGIPYVVGEFGDEGPKGFVGPFATRAVWSIVPGSVKVMPLEETAELEDGTVIALKQKNLLGVLVEGYYAFKTFNKDDFRQLETNVANSGS